MTQTSHRLVRIACLAAITWLGAEASAQSTSGDPPTLDRVTVTGSNINRVEVEGVSPVQVITADEILRSGKTTLTEVLRGLPSAGGNGLSDSAGANSFSAGASSVSLRGLGSQATLVLLNGRRVAPYAPADPNKGQASAVNLDSFPLDVVDRVEILKDGASAIYGSDAMAGVINIITREEFTGGFFDLSGKTNNRGHYNTGDVSATMGHGELAKDGYNVFLNIEYSQRNRTAFRQEDSDLIDPRFTASPLYRTGSKLYSSYAGNYYTPDVFDPQTLGSASYGDFAGRAPGCPAGQIAPNDVCRFDIWPYVDLESKSDRLNVFSRGTVQVGPALSLFSELGYNKVKTFVHGAPGTYGDLGPWFASATGQLVNVPEVLPPGNPSNPSEDYIGYRHRFTEVGPQNSAIDTDAFRAVVGAKGSVASWDLESALAYSVNKYSQTSFNQLRTSALTDGILNGTYNFLDPNAGSLRPGDLRIDSTDRAKSDYYMVDFKGTRELMPLPGGALAVATGAEFRHESRSTSPDVNKQIGEVVGFGNAAAEGSRNVSTVYAELSAPLWKDVEAQLAGRVDHYNDFGTAATPKVGLSWKALPSLRLRGTFERGFRAPSLTEISKSDVSAFTTVTDPKRCILGTEDDCGGTNIGELIASNPNLKPERSRGLNFGFVWEPVTDVSLSVDYFSIKRRNEVAVLSEDEILRNEDSTDPRYVGRVQRGPVDPTTPDLPGKIQTIVTGYFNLGMTKVAGFDFDGRYKLKLQGLGTITAGAQVTLNTTYQDSGGEGAPLVERIGYNGHPRVRGSGDLNWDYNDVSTSASVNFVSGYKTFDPVELDAQQCENTSLLGICRVGAWTTFDLGVSYTGFTRTRLSLVVGNLFDRKPPVDPFTYGLPAYNADFHNPYGRTFRLALRYDFL